MSYKTLLRFYFQCNGSAEVMAAVQQRIIPFFDIVE